MITMLSVCLWMPPINFEHLNQHLWNLVCGMYNMEPELIWTAYFKNPSHQSVCLHLYPHIVARRQLGKKRYCGTCRIKGK
jgi:hypothetical protein